MEEEEEEEEEEMMRFTRDLLVTFKTWKSASLGEYALVYVGSG